MRIVATIGCAAFLLAAIGCTEGRLNFLRPSNNQGPVTDPPPSVDALVHYLNENSTRLQTVKCNDLGLTVSAGVVPISLRGKMLCERPKSLRLSADTPLGSGQEVDLGSNQEEFWWWVKRDNPPYQYYCTYAALQEGRVRQLNLPFQPDWIIDSLGMGNYGPASRYQLKVEPEKLLLVETVRSPNGQALKKVIVFNRRPARGSQPQVTDFLLLEDGSNKEIAAAHITEIQVDTGAGGKGGTLPRKMELRWAKENIRLGLNLSGVTFNAPLNSEVAFRRLPMTGVPSYDLATGKTDAQQNSIQRVGGPR